MLLDPEWKDMLNSLIPVAGHRMRFTKHVKQLNDKSEPKEVIA